VVVVGGGWWLVGDNDNDEHWTMVQRHLRFVKTAVCTY